MNCYMVGGCVRDACLGLTPLDRDWVVVGATEEEMLAAGFCMVGRGFPVFLHPTTHEEYALARTEKKNGHGYRGFTVYASPTVCLEDDLRRRDLTINAIAQAPDGTYIDPFGGRADLSARILRHVSEAFVEDPLRVLRVARFAARFPTFSIAPETWALMRSMWEELSFLVPERVGHEWQKAMMTRAPGRFFEVLHEVGALSLVWPDQHIVSPRTRSLLTALGQSSLDQDARCIAVLSLCASQDELASCMIRMALPKRYQKQAASLASFWYASERSPRFYCDLLEKHWKIRHSSVFFDQALAIIQTMCANGERVCQWLRSAYHILSTVSPLSFMTNDESKTIDYQVYQASLVQALSEIYPDVNPFMTNY